MLIIIDLGMGNFGSVLNMCKKVSIEAKISNKIEDIEKADNLILPGVGHFDNAIKQINKLNLYNVLKKKVLTEKIPILGICLGMQILFTISEEGKLDGLNFIKGKVIKFRKKEEFNLKLPHMGWNSVSIVKNDKIFEGLINPRFYFVHNYHVIPEDQDLIIGKTYYGYDFVSAIKKENIYGVQFHPEKSHKYGKKLFENFKLIK